MEKKMWVAPQMEGMEFLAGEYCESVCGTDNVIYNFTCDAGDGESGYVWLETNDVAGLQKDAGTAADGTKYEADYFLCGNRNAEHSSTYSACGATHQASAKDPFLDGYYQEYSSRYGLTGNVINVIVWEGEKQNNVHCTTQLDMNKWTTAKS